MALFELLFSSLLFGLVFSAPVEVTTATDETLIPTSTVSDLPPSTSSESLSSTPEFPKSPLWKQISFPYPKGPVVTDKDGVSPLLDKEVTSPRPYDHSLQKSPKPTPNTESITDGKVDGQEGADQRRRLPQTEAERAAASVPKAVRALPDGYGGPYFRQQPDDSQSDAREPLPDPYYRESPQVPEESPPQSSYRVDYGDGRFVIPTEPQEQRLEPKDEPIIVVEVEPIVQEEIVSPPSQPYQEQISQEGAHEDFPQSSYEPQAEQPSQSDDRPAKEGERADVGQPESVRPSYYYPYSQPEDPVRDPALEQDDGLDDPSLPFEVDESDGDHVPQAPPAVLVREDLASPILQVRQDAPQYDGEGYVPPKLEYTKKEKYSGDRGKKYRY